MQKSSVLFLLAGGLIIGGLALSVWGNQVIFEDFVKDEGIIVSGEEIRVSTAMKVSEQGIFAVDVLQLKEDSIFVTVIDPFENQIVQQMANQETFEGYFDVNTAGNYTLVITNSDEEDAFVAGYIGPEPDALKRSIAFVSIYVLIVGLVSIVIVIVYAIVKRK